MSKVKDVPPVLLLRALWLRLQGRVQFPHNRIDEVIAGETESFRVFRQMVVDPSLDDGAPPGAVFDVRFQFKRFSPAANKRLSGIPMPFIAVQPGFRSKTWMVGEESGAFRGLYEWATVAEAESYWDSFPMRMMRRRAIAGTLVKSVTGNRPSGGDR